MTAFILPGESHGLCVAFRTQQINSRFYLRDGYQKMFYCCLDQYLLLM